MRTQTRPGASVQRNREYADPFVPAPAAGQTESAPARPNPAGRYDVPDALPKRDAMQESSLVTAGFAPELDGQEELGPPLAWVSLDAPRGLLVCKNLDLEVTEVVGTIIESRVVRVMKDRDEKDEDGSVYCASSNQKLADVGRPGRECASCEDRSGWCFPRWWIAWQEAETGQVFAHTLSQTGTLNFTRYAAKLRRKGLTPSQTVTRLFVEEAPQHKAGTTYRRIQFERDDPFKDQ